MRVVEIGRFLTPPDAHAARRYLRESLLSVHGRRSRLNAIAGRVGLGERELEISGLLALDLARSIAPAASHEWVVLRDYAGLRQRTLVFLFGGDGRPALVVKSRPSHAPGASLRQERDALRAMRLALGEPLRSTLPVVIAFDTRDDHELLALTAMPGRPLDISMQRSLLPRASHAQHLAAAGAWLGDFHAATRAGSRTAVHGDFWTRNLLFDGNTLCGVVDWERAAATGEPWEDLFTLPLLFATAAPAWFRRRDPIREFLRSFTGSGPVAGAISGYFAAYSARSGCDGRNLRDSFEGFLAQQVHRGTHDETAWKSSYRWRAMLGILRSSSHSVFQEASC